MANRGGRSVFAFIWNNFVNSLKPRQRQGNFVGADYLGNTYFEIPAQPEIGKRRSERWFVPPGKISDGYNQELTAEWEAWLRHRRCTKFIFLTAQYTRITYIYNIFNLVTCRNDPPTEKELKQNLAIMNMKKFNASKLDEKFQTTKLEQQITGASNFPRYDEFERIVGKPSKDE